MKKLLAILLSWQLCAATYYVQPYGNNANPGTGPGASQAWQTITYALNTASISAGDTIYIGPGVYREQVTLNKGFAFTPLYVRGDPRNEQGFTDGSGNRLKPSPVRWTAHTSGDKTAATGNLLTAGASTTNYLFFDLWLVTDATYNCFATSDSSTSGYAIGFTRCCFTGRRAASLYAGVNQSIGVHWTNCVMLGAYSGISINVSTPTVETDLDVGLIDSSIISGQYGIYVADESAALTGLEMKNSMIFANYCLNWTTDDTPVNPSPVIGNVFVGATGIQGASGSPIANSYNLYFCYTPRYGTGISAGPGERTVCSLLTDMGQSALWFNKPVPFMMPTFDSPLLAFRGDIPAGTGGFDFLGRIRPSGPGLLWGSGYATNAVGPLEYYDIGAQEASVVDDKTYSCRLTGPGDHLIRVPVDASSTTLTLRIRKDSTYSGNQPAVKRVAQPELIASDSGETKTMTAGADTWETLTFTSFTPSRKGVVYLIVESYDTAGNGNVYVDTVTRNY